MHQTSNANATATHGMTGSEQIDRLVDPAVRAMMVNGIRVDVRALEDHRVQLIQRQIIFGHRVNELAPRPLDPANEKDVGDWIRGHDFPIPVGFVPGRTRHAGTNDKLRQLGEHLALARYILGHREGEHATHFLAGVRRRVRPGNDRVHFRLDVCGAETGRITCSEPPLQCTPRELRRLFVADPAHVLLVADFEQFELVVLALLSNDQTLLDAAYRGGDLHRTTASRLLGVPEWKITKDKRRLGKAVNFAIIFGQTEWALAKKLGITVEEASRFIRGFQQSYVVAHNWLENLKACVVQTGMATTLWGRTRCLPDAQAIDPGRRARGQRQAVSTAIQGTAAEIFKLALIRLHHNIPPHWRLLLPIHDAVLMEVPAVESYDAAREVRRILEILPPGIIMPLRAKVACGRNWGECG